ncbi:MAG: MBL fold metallo-hydrolase [Hydrogenovibrio sp.]|nr:MBL fold metallo-hydrolase [Hydrogenovibrio sp.]
MTIKIRYLVFTVAVWMVSSVASAEPLKLVKLDKAVYAIVGETTDRTPENLGNNATFGFVIGQKGVALIDAGGSYQGAKAIEAMVRTVTHKPILYVINTGGQDHRWLGSGYFSQQGATIIASQAADKDHKARLNQQMSRLQMLVGSKGMAGTKAKYADKTFAKSMTLDLGNIKLYLHHVAPAHTPGDAFVWIPSHGILFSGDIVYVDRMLGVMPYSNTMGWLESFQAIADRHPRVIVPGHGAPTTLAKAKKDTYDYLVYLRQSVRAFMDGGGDISDIRQVDQSAYQYLKNFDSLSGLNAQQVYTELEFE